MSNPVSLRPRDSRVSTAESEVTTLARKEVWLDGIVRVGDWRVKLQENIASTNFLSGNNRIKFLLNICLYILDSDVLLVGMIPVFTVALYLMSSLIRVLALLFTPIAVFAPVLAIYHSKWSSSVKVAAGLVFCGTTLVFNTFGLLSYPLYFMLETVPQFITTSYYLAVYVPCLVFGAAILALVHRANLLH